ncbi:malate synthase [Tenacibaculum sp. MAR_2009_124]|uniref:malate synthase A n=1 Tax=Tenacibaculum sp. MAR_2009_124 TaxID=1250059 RepID=UPI00089BFD2F|nr:malate synthase A [Tenacibaculum sp. MAR_2009_124]SEB40202.1 malate synthase [Tenacibaculum sp. MAR_2009_124]
MNTETITKEIGLTGFNTVNYNDVLTEEALSFLVALHKTFNKERLSLLEDRKIYQAYFDAGNFPSFPEETKELRRSDWVCAPLPKDLLDRRVEITGPVSRKMIINALNSGAKTFMADFEDSNSPTIENVLNGQVNLRDAVNGTISFYDERRSKSYQLNEMTAVLLVRPRGLHLNEKHITIKGEEMSASLVDFGLYFFHNIHKLLKKDSASYFYLPKLEHYLEARWWNDVFVFAQDYLNIPQGTIKATVLVETITASFQLDEIIYELKNHMAGLNCGRWDYIFSYIKKFRKHQNFIVPNRSQVTMQTPFMEAYSLRVIQKCHKRGVHAMGGMAAQIPVKNNEEANKLAFAKVRKDKEQEAKNGHDGTWVAHPGLVEIARSVFNEYMPNKNQIGKRIDELIITEEALVELPKGTITEQGVRDNINVGILYIESWLKGNGAAALYNLMEDAATAEISRTQVWQWLRSEVSLDNGQLLNKELYQFLKEEEVTKIKNLVGGDRFNSGRFEEAIKLFDELVLTEDFIEFLTLPAYEIL